MSVRDRVLTSAEELFATKGYAATSVQDIIDKAEVSKGGLYHHFTSKEDILDALLLDFAKLLKNKFETASQDASTIDEVFWQFASAKELLPKKHQELYGQFLMNQDEIVIREKFLHYIREEMVDIIAASIEKHTSLHNPEVISYLIISLTEIPTRLPLEKTTQTEFMKEFQSAFQKILDIFLL